MARAARALWRAGLASAIIANSLVSAKEMFCEITGPCKSVGPSHTLHKRVDGSVFSIGRNNFGQLGDGTRTHRTSPVAVSTQSPVSYVSVGGWHSVFLRTNGEAIATGKNDKGQLGDGTFVTRTIPVRMSADACIAASAGYQHSIFLKTDGTAWATGSNECGQLGQGDYKFRNTPVMVMNNVTAISAGETHNLFVRSDGTVWCVGSNTYGQCGDSSTLMRPTPSQATIDNVASVIAGQHKSLFIKTDGTVWASGQVDDSLGYISGPDWPRSTPVQIAPNLDAIITSDGSARIENAVLGQPVYATDQRFPLDDPNYAQTLNAADPDGTYILPGIGFSNWNYR